MGRPAKFRFFTCPSCAALYQVVRSEAGPETKAAELACLTCAAPLSPRDGKFVLKYFLLREGRRKCGCRACALSNSGSLAREISIIFHKDVRARDTFPCLTCRFFPPTSRS